jgi:hypothetical protein
MSGRRSRQQGNTNRKPACAGETIGLAIVYRSRRMCFPVDIWKNCRYYSNVETRIPGGFYQGLALSVKSLEKADAGDRRAMVRMNVPVFPTSTTGAASGRSAGGQDRRVE